MTNDGPAGEGRPELPVCRSSSNALAHTRAPARLNSASGRMASGPQVPGQRSQPVQAALSMATKVSSFSLPLGLMTVSRRVTAMAGQPTASQLEQPVQSSASTA